MTITIHPIGGVRFWGAVSPNGRTESQKYNALARKLTAEEIRKKYKMYCEPNEYLDRHVQLEKVATAAEISWRIGQRTGQARPIKLKELDGEAGTELRAKFGHV